MVVLLKSIYTLKISRNIGNIYPPDPNNPSSTCRIYSPAAPMLSRAKRLSSASALTAIVAMQNISLESILFCVLILFTFRLVLFFREVFFFLVAIVTPAVWFSILEMQICVKEQSVMFYRKKYSINGKNMQTKSTSIRLSLVLRASVYTYKACHKTRLLLI